MSHKDEYKSIYNLFQEVDNNFVYNKKFHTTRFKSTFVFDKFESVKSPIDALRHCFQKTIDRAINKSKFEGCDPDRIGVSISSQNLQPDIFIHFTKITENTVDSIFNRFQIVHQSKTTENSLLGILILFI